VSGSGKNIFFNNMGVFIESFSLIRSAFLLRLILFPLLFHFKNTLMLAMNFRGPFQIRADPNRPEPEIKHPYDAIVRVTRSLVCSSDLHLYHGLVPDTRVGMTFAMNLLEQWKKLDQGYKS
jgi:hypothetical protein